MKKILIFITYFVLGFFLIFSYIKINQSINSRQLNTPLPQSNFSIEVAPNESLRGTIISVSGQVEWQSRIATQAAKITKPMQVQQGEKIITLKNGNATIMFSNTVNFNIYPRTEIDIIQTLPENILIEQNTGICNYKKTGSNSLSVRSHGLLIKITQGEIAVSINEDLPYVSVDIIKGSITAAYNDIDFITQVMDVSSQNRLLFNTDTKTVRILKI